VTARDFLEWATVATIVALMFGALASAAVAAWKVLR
jgi:hypothetical protein